MLKKVFDTDCHDFMDRMHLLTMSFAEVADATPWSLTPTAQREPRLACPSRESVNLQSAGFGYRTCEVGYLVGYFFEYL